MADAGVLQEIQETGVLVEFLESGREDPESLIGRGGEGSESPKPRISARNKSLRSSFAQGCLVKSMPKSPFLRMTEMRRGGLRAKDLNQIFLTLPPPSSTKLAFKLARHTQMSSKEVRDGKESIEKEMGLVISESTMAMVEMENVLDLCEAQPLQNMTYLLPKANSELGKREEELEAGAVSGKWAKLEEMNTHDCLMGELFSNEEFPLCAMNPYGL